MRNSRSHPVEVGSGGACFGKSKWCSWLSSDVVVYQRRDLKCDASDVHDIAYYLHGAESLFGT